MPRNAAWVAASTVPSLAPGAARGREDGLVGELAVVGPEDPLVALRVPDLGRTPGDDDGAVADLQEGRAVGADEGGQQAGAVVERLHRQRGGLVGTGGRGARVHHPGGRLDDGIEAAPAGPGAHPVERRDLDHHRSGRRRLGGEALPGQAAGAIRVDPHVGVGQQLGEGR